MENLTYDLIMVGVGLLVFLIRVWVLHKNETLEQKAEYAQNVILTALAQTKIQDNRKSNISAGPATLAAPDLKAFAVNLIATELQKNKKTQKVFDSLGITREDIEDGIETGLHATKLGIQNVLKNGFKQNGEKMLRLQKS